MRIDIVTPPVRRDTFTGGLWCIFQYAQGLADRGHEVAVIPMVPSPFPTWVPEKSSFSYIASTPYKQWTTSLQSMKSAAQNMIAERKLDKVVARDSLSALIEASLQPASKAQSFEMARGLSISYLRRQLSNRTPDITVATHFETVLPVLLYSNGSRAYFGQHFEPLFWKDYKGGAASRAEARLGYHTGIPIIANSSWLRGMILKENPAADVDLCLNAINHEHFWPNVRSDDKADTSDRVRVISYGGRGVRWKGFPEMAEAVAIARQSSLGSRFSWHVYGGVGGHQGAGDGLYEDLGFLRPKQLGQAYRDSDILLSGSWYESFPLFPLEAMACGLATITTAPGTEDYATNGQNAEVVAERDPVALADSLLRLIRDQEYRMLLAARAAHDALSFTWANSVDTMESILASLIRRGKATQLTLSDGEVDL